MAGQSRSKNGVLKNAYVPAIHVLHSGAMPSGYVYVLTNRPNGILYVGVTAIWSDAFMSIEQARLQVLQNDMV